MRKSRGHASQPTPWRSAPPARAGLWRSGCGSPVRPEWARMAARAARPLVARCSLLAGRARRSLAAARGRHRARTPAEPARVRTPRRSRPGGRRERSVLRAVGPRPRPRPGGAATRRRCAELYVPGSRGRARATLALLRRTPTAGCGWPALRTQVLVLVGGSEPADRLRAAGDRPGRRASGRAPGAERPELGCPADRPTRRRLTLLRSARARWRWRRVGTGLRRQCPTGEDRRDVAVAELVAQGSSSGRGSMSSEPSSSGASRPGTQTQHRRAGTASGRTAVRPRRRRLSVNSALVGVSGLHRLNGPVAASGARRGARPRRPSRAARSPGSTAGRRRAARRGRA